ncbi:MAG: helix-turn-helix transcriptional regulator [Oscillospiraceae bacterium]|nr:helix-turn-helix transcriptional regulator [Oscillospiraceae bacterium]
MKIYFKQPDKTDGYSPFSVLNLRDCYLKHLIIDSDASKITSKPHHHNGFEIHIIEKGQQTYEADGKLHCTNSGEFFFIPPFVKHRVLSSSPGTEKFSLVFSSTELSYLTECVSDIVPARLLENIYFIINEYCNATSLSEHIIQNSVCESVIMLLRLCGLRELASDKNTEEPEDLRLDAAKAYIQDNIESWLTVSDIAAYCHISTKQITRIFLKNEGISPAQYIAKSRIDHIHKLLESKELSLREISEKMNFQNEYYFNTFVKKHLGMPPGEYRKMTK